MDRQVAHGQPDRDDESHVPKNDNQGSRLLRLAKETFTFHLSLAGEPFAVPRQGPRVAVLLNGDAGVFRRSLARIYAQKFHGAPSAQAISDAVRVLHGDAEVRTPEPLHVRVAPLGDSIVLDLGTAEGDAAVISPGRWEVVRRPSVPFRRTRGLTGSLPIPVDGGNIDDLALLSGLDPNGPQAHLITGWAVAALKPDISHPVLLLRGPQGSGKTTLARMLVDLIDPSPASVRSLPPVNDWHNTVKSSYVIGLDNVTTLSQEQTSQLCTAATGDAYVKRALYTDDGTNVTAFRRPIVMTSIGLNGLRGDLADRMMIVNLPVIEPRARRAERDMLEEYEFLRPGLVGQLLAGLGTVLHALPQVKGDLRSRPRLADFYEVLSALDRDAVGRPFTSAFDALASDLAQEVVDSDSFVSRIQALMQSASTSVGAGRHAWEGTVSQLIAKIQPTPAPRDWPKSAHVASQRLAHAEPALKAVGVYLTRSRNNKGSLITLDSQEQ